MQTNLRTRPSVVAVTADIATTGFIDYRGASKGFFEVDDADLTTITWYSFSDADGATKVAANTAGGVAITQTVANDKSYEIPTTLAGAAYLYPLGNNAGTIRVDVKT